MCSITRWCGGSSIFAVVWMRRKKLQQWEYMARALRAFYVNERIYPELLKLDQAIHERLNSAESAAMLAETQLAMDQNAAAVQTLSALEPGKTTAMAQLLLGIALVRSGKADQAKRYCGECQLAKGRRPKRHVHSGPSLCGNGGFGKGNGVAESVLRGHAAKSIGRLQVARQDMSRVCCNGVHSRVRRRYENGVEGARVEMQRRE